MSSWAEGAVALLVTLVLGLGLFLYSGQSLTDETTDTTQPAAADPEAAARGEVLAEGQGCLQCHTTDGSAGSAPTWKGLAGSTRPLTNGEQVTADDAYLFSSIIDPHSQVVEGFQAIMPAFYADQLDDDQVDDLVEYIKSLSA